ncbi:ABC transporter substrate-binding protein [Halocatena pleomorpha]|uniref:ABC transporter substrate-binding protein n=1 Tax=Halocatena pleomorpha TaxID=1785090 RepID=A0A3P3RAG8_9EURY|nr:ABC transporter substrate-binding protein [Halocatena pleomorpha]RRJ29680.1 ABC transporter substrate-binding protein [Halocatena pleomorpha]
MARYTGPRSSPINRRQLLRGIGVASVVGLAGCLNGDNNEDNGGNNTNKLEQLEEPNVDFANAQTGGTLRIGATTNVESFDPPYSTDAQSTQAQDFIFEQLVTADRKGNLYPWLAKSYEQREIQEIDRTAYTEYMTSVGTTDKGAPDTDAQIIVQHPEDDPAKSDEVRVLTPKEAADAVDDGVYGMQFRYQLRKGVKFHNGEELTAENVVRTAERYENSDVSAQTFDSLLHARAVDKYTVDLFAQVPDAEAERELPGLYIHATEQAGLDDGALDPRQGNTPIGTGPYTLDTFEDGQYYELSKFGNYWVENKGVDSIDWFDGPSAFPDGPVIEKLAVEIIPDAASRSAALQNDEIDVTSGLASNTLDEFHSDDGYRVAAVEGGSYDYIQYPVNTEPWNDERFRRAVNHLVPRESIVNNVLNGWGRPAWTSIPKLAEKNGTADIDALEKEIRPSNEYDTEKAAELLDEVGNELDIEYPIEIQMEVNANNKDRVSMVELIAESMEQTDYFKVSIESYEWNTYTARVINPDYQNKGLLPAIGLSGTFNPESFCEALHHSNNVGQCCNLNGINDPKLDQMINDARYDPTVVKDPSVRAKRYDEIWKYLAKKRYSSITHFSTTSAVMRTNVTGFKANPFTEFLYSFALYAPEESQAIWLEKSD